MIISQLTFAISMISNRSVVMLDEPSTGMDPQSKRKLWNVIMQNLTGGDRGGILTTHSMEEADALCDRIGIMAKGQLRCIGSSQHLKNKFASGYILDAKFLLPSDQLDSPGYSPGEPLKMAILRILPGATCVEEVYNRLVFSVSSEHVANLGGVFAHLEKSEF